MGSAALGEVRKRIPERKVRRYGLHCHVFVTNDKATATKSHFLNEFWNLGRECRLVGQKEGAP